MLMLEYYVLSRTISKNQLDYVPLGPKRQDEKRNLVSLPSFLDNGMTFIGGSDVFIPGLGEWKWRKAALANKMLPKPRPNQNMPSKATERC